MIELPADASKRYLIGVVGDAPALLPFFDILKHHANGKVLSQIGLVAAALPDARANTSSKDLGLSIPVYPEFRQMLAAHPEINMLFECTGQAKLLAEMRRDLPPKVTLVERSAANFFIRLLSDDSMWLACKLDLMNTQALLTTVIDQLAEEILYIGREGRVVNLNAAAAKAQGKGKQEVIGLPYHDVFREFSAGNSSGALDPVAKAIQRRTPAETLTSLVDPEGRMQYFRVYTYPIFDDAKELTHVVAMRRDITQRTHMEQRLQQSERLASIGELSTYIAHEIRNPLFAISGFANSLLRSVTQDEKSREKLKIILEESKRLDGILKSILNFSRPIEASAGITDVNEVVRSTLDVMCLGCELKGIFVLKDLTEPMAKAKADPELVKQSLINLVKNSMEAMPEGGTLTVRTGLTRDYVTLEVEDTGAGIQPEIRDKVFSPFFSTKGKGAGLGLAMIRKIIDDIGGDLELVSKVGEGTRVTLFLPPVLAVPGTEQAA